MDWFKPTVFLSLLVASAFGQTREERLANNRLPGDLKPYHYYVELKADIYNETTNNHSYTGIVEVFFQCETATNEIYLNIKDYEPDINSLTIRTATGNSVPAADPIITDAKADQDSEFYIISLQSSLTAGVRYRLGMEFARPLSQNGRGFFQLSYESNFETRWVAATRFSASDARAAFPCFDEPEYKATFDIVLLRKIEYRTVGNMHIVRQDPRPDEWIADVYARTPVMSTFTLAFIVCDFQYRERVSPRGVVSRIWSRADQLALTERASGFSVEVLEWYENYFGINYPLTKLDHIAVPLNDQVAIVYGWGLILYSERVLLYDEDESDIIDLFRTYTGLSHETAHQWFGNLVTAKWWDDNWINEGITTYFNFAPFGDLLQWNGFQLQSTFTVLDALRRDARPNVPALAEKRNTPMDSRLAFNLITYQKGAAFMRMLRYAVGSTTFQSALQMFLQKHQYGSVTTDDFWTTFQEQVDADNVTEPDGQTRLVVKDKFDPWVRQAGYPVVSFDRDTPFGILARLNQTRFVMFMDSEVDRPSPWNYQWWVPITVSHEDQPQRTRDTEFYLPPNTVLEVTQGLPPSSKLLVANTDQVGMYRVKYDQASLDRLRTAIDDQDLRIPTQNRAALLDDIFRIDRAFRIPEIEALNFTRQFRFENQLLPWRIVLDNIGFHDLMFRRESLFGDLERYWRERVDLLWRRNRNPRPTDVSRRMVRQFATFWSCWYNNAQCIQEAVEAFDNWWTNPITQPLHPDQHLNYMCMAVRAGEEFEWNVVYGLYRAFNSYRTERRYLAAMACTRDYYLLERYMVLMEDGDIPGIGAIYLSFNTLGAEIVWRHLRDRWVESPFPERTKLLMLLVNAIARNRQEELEEFDDFVASNPPATEGEERVFNRTREIIENNVAWMKLNEGPVRDWLRENAPPPSDKSADHFSPEGGLGLMGLALHLHTEELLFKQDMGQLDRDLTQEDLFVEALQDLLPHVHL